MNLMKTVLFTELKLMLWLNNFAQRSSVAQVRDCGVQAYQTTPTKKAGYNASILQRNPYWCYTLLVPVIYLIIKLLKL